MSNNIIEVKNETFQSSQYKFKTLDNMLKDIHGKARRYIENTKDVINYNQQ